MVQKSQILNKELSLPTIDLKMDLFEIVTQFRILSLNQLHYVDWLSK